MSALALYGATTDFCVSREWFPWATGIAIFAPLGTLPLLRSAALLSVPAETVGLGVKNWFVVYILSIIATALIFGCALPALGTALLGDDERTSVQVAARKERPRRNRWWSSGANFEVVMRLADGNYGTYSVDEDTYLKFERGGGSTHAQIRRSWFGFNVIEIEGSSGPGGSTPRLVF